MGDLICIKTYSQKDEAGLAKNLLEVNDVQSIVSADDAGGVNPALGWATGGARLMIKEKDKERALEILKETKK